jgi:hypothetical protein
MRRSLTRWLAIGLVAGLVLAAVPLLSAESPVEGTWKVTALPGGDELALWLVRVEEKDGKPQATLLSAGSADLKNYTVEATRADDQSLRLTLKSKVSNQQFSVVGHVPKGETKPKRLLGSIGFQGGRDIGWLERSDLKELPAGKTAARGPAAEALQTAGQSADPKKPEVDPKKLTADLSAVVQKYPTHPAAVFAAFELVRVGVDMQEADVELRKRAEQALKLVAPYGREMELQVTRQIGQALTQAPPSHKNYLKTIAPVAHEYAVKAQKLLTADDPADTQAAVLKTLADSLRRIGKSEEAKTVQEKLAKLEETLDQEYLKGAIAFKVEPFAGRKAEGNRVALVELFTGVQCPPCVAADLAFDAALKAYKPTDVVFLQYHLHIPGPDPLTNGDSEKRGEFYGVEGTPYVFLNGQLVKGPEGQGVGGFAEHAEPRYKYLRAEIDPKLEGEAQATMKITAERKAPRVETQIEVSGLKRTGDHVRLHVVLVEDTVRYLGGNGQRLHHHAVRSLPRGADGIPLKQAATKERVALDLNQVRKSLDDYLNTFAGTFPEEDRPLDLKQLKVIAFIQDHKTKEVLHAAQAEVP